MNNTYDNLSNKTSDSHRSDSTSSSSTSSCSNASKIIERIELALRRPSQQHVYHKHTRHLSSRVALQLFNTNKPIHISKKDSNNILVAADTIFDHIELPEDIMQDDPVSQMRRMSAVRNLPQSIAVKRTIKAKLTRSVNEKVQKRKLNCWRFIKYSMSFSLMQTLIVIKNLMFCIEFWYSTIKSIEGHFGSGVATYFKFLRWLLILNLINCTLSLSFIIIPQLLTEVYSENAEFQFSDLFIGDGFLENTVLFYGFYSNTTIENIPGHQYNIPSAYVITMFICYTLTFILLSVKVARSYRECYIETSGGVHNLYVTKIFCSWDYSITSYKAAKLCSSSIYCELTELLAERNTTCHSNRLSIFGRFIIKTAVTLIVLATMSGTGALTWYLLKLHTIRDADSPSLLIIPVTITGIMIITPIIMTQLAKLERYDSKRNALYMTMIRVYAMAIVVLTTLLYYWLSYSAIDCWQTKLGQEIYRLVVVDFFIFVIGSFITSGLHYYIHRKIRWCGIGAPKFDIASNTLNLIYNQILFWIAFYFSPPLSLIIVIKMVLTFHIKKLGLTMHCGPPSTPWRAAQTQTLFLALAFLGMTGALTMLGYIVTSVRSNYCGPFRMYNYTWEAIVEAVFNLKHDSKFYRVATALAKPGVGAAILIIMSITVYWLRAKAIASKEMVEILREMLVLESRDKDFLLNEFSKVADEDWLRRRTAFNESRASVRERQCDSQRFPRSRKSNRISAGDGILHTTIDEASPGCSEINVILNNS